MMRNNKVARILRMKIKLKKKTPRRRNLQSRKKAIKGRRSHLHLMSLW